MSNQSESSNTTPRYIAVKSKKEGSENFYVHDTKVGRNIDNVYRTEARAQAWADVFNAENALEEQKAKIAEMEKKASNFRYNALQVAPPQGLSTDRESFEESFRKRNRSNLKPAPVKKVDPNEELNKALKAFSSVISSISTVTAGVTPQPTLTSETEGSDEE